MDLKSTIDWPEAILTAEKRIRAYIVETPLEHSPYLSSIGGSEVYLKLEHVQHTGSFKLRGAINKILSLAPEQLSRGVIAASTGNHGMAVSYAARKKGIDATVYMQEGASSEKVAIIESFGGKVRFFGSNPVDAENKARTTSQQTGQIFISPYNDPQVIAGQGSVGVEMRRQLERIDAVFVSVGGGGLIAGIGSHLKSSDGNVEVVGCCPKNSRVLYECMQAGKIIEYPEQPTLSDSTAGGVEEGAITLGLCQKFIDRCVLVSEEEIAKALRLLLEKERWLVEGSAAVAIAAYLKKAVEYRGKNIVIVLCGRNI